MTGAQLSITFTSHRFENNPISQAHLDANREKFGHDCFKILQRLINREKLTVKGAMLEGLSGHLPRRIADLKEYGFDISTEPVLVNGRKSHIQYYMSNQDLIKACTVIAGKLERKKQNNG